MGFQLKSPTPGVFQNQFPTPMGDGGGDPMGPPWGMGVVPKPYLAGIIFFYFQNISNITTYIVTFIVCFYLKSLKNFTNFFTI